jgi:glycosyltransferase involved in cell wall biosynthesis
MSDAGIFFIKPSFSKQGSSPTKLGEMLSMGIPVICNAGVGDVESIINATQTGTCLTSFSETEMAEVIETIAQMNDKTMNVEKAQKAIAFFSLEQGIKSYLGIYESLLGKP